MTTLQQEDKIGKASKAVAGAVEWTLATILRTINFVLRNFVKFCMKDIKGIFFVLLAIWFICVVVILKLTYDTKVEMLKSINSVEEITVPVVIKEPPAEVQQEIDTLQPEISPSKYDTSKAVEFIRSYRQGNSPIIDYVDYFFQEDIEKGKLALAICGNETAFGTVGYGIDKWNCWGWMADLGGSNWGENIKNYTQKANGYLSMFDGTKESIRAIANAGYYKVGMSGSTIENQNNWVNSVHWFYNNL